jgi:tRNA(fMet)-specific endonuclease VapC
MLDTNVIIKYLAGDRLSKQLIDSAFEISISVIVMGELQYGAHKSSRVESNLTLFANFLSNFEIVPVDESIAAVYGEVKKQLHEIGMNIPENDIWIAASAITRKCSLLTYDAHFKSVDGLSVIS